MEDKDHARRGSQNGDHKPAAARRVVPPLTVVLLSLGPLLVVILLLTNLATREPAAPGYGPDLPTGVTVLPDGAEVMPPTGWPILHATVDPAARAVASPTMVTEALVPTVQSTAADTPTGSGQEAISPNPILAAPAPTAILSTISPPATNLTSPEVRTTQWVAQLSNDAERVGQLLLLGWTGTTAEEARTIIREFRPGGIVFIDNARTAAGAKQINMGLRALSAEYQLPPLLLAIDHEGGQVQRIGGVANLGSNRGFAQAQPSEQAACQRGQTHGRQLQSMGFNTNLAPVLDVNNNPANPVIGDRSYGPSPDAVARLGSAYVRGLQGEGIIAVGKHFPGHGNTRADSHLELPVLSQPLDLLEQVELVPFRRAVESSTDLAAIMSAHIVFRALDPDLPATLSPAVMTQLLRREVRFDGLVLSDDLGAMRAITDHYRPGDAAVRAISAGVDMLIIGGGVARQRESRDALVAALRSGALRPERVDEALRHVLNAKARFGVLDDIAPAGRGCFN
jgi:beta-N-acetylhexosaminidase